MTTFSTRPALALAAVVAAFALSGCSAQLADDTQDDVGSSEYSLTQVIRNNSGVDLTVDSVTADNGGAVESGYPTVVKAGTDGTFVAKNSGNGVQVKVTLSLSDGKTLLVDSDVPKVDENWSSADVPEASGLTIDAISIGGGDNPTADVTIATCADGKKCTTNTSTKDGPVVGSTDAPDGE